MTEARVKELAMDIAKDRVKHLYRKQWWQCVNYAIEFNSPYDKRDRYLVEAMSKNQIIAMCRTYKFKHIFMDLKIKYGLVKV